MVKTTEAPAEPLILPDRCEINADGSNLSFVTVTAADNDGLRVPCSKNLIDFEISGPGEIVAVDNVDATSLEPFKSKQIKAFNGLALVIVRAKKGESGTITVHAASKGMEGATATITGK